MISPGALSQLLRTLYGAPQSPELWPQFLRELSEMLGFTGAAILYHDLEHADYSVQLSSSKYCEWSDLYTNHYGKLDAWRDPFLKLAEGEFGFGDDLCPPDKLKRTEFYNDFLTKFDIRLFGAVATIKRPSQVEHISLYQSWKGKRPRRDTVGVMALVFPHLRCALDLRRRFVDLHAKNSLLDSALNEMAAGVLLLDGSGRVLLTNRSAENLLREVDGLLIRERRLRTSVLAETAQLNALISRASATASRSGTASGGAVLVSRTIRRPLTLTIAPLTSVAAPLPQSAVAIAFIHDPEQQIQPPAGFLECCYQLTPAEARLALLLVAGHTLKEAAEACGVTHNTVRSQLKAIFQKTGVRRQSELVLLLGKLCSQGSS